MAQHIKVFFDKPDNKVPTSELVEELGKRRQLNPVNCLLAFTHTIEQNHTLINVTNTCTQNLYLLSLYLSIACFSVIQ